jgi:large repetitive protein
VDYPDVFEKPRRHATAIGRLAGVALLGLMLWLAAAAPVSAQSMPPSAPCTVGVGTVPPGWTAVPIGSSPDCSNATGWAGLTGQYSWVMGNVPAPAPGVATFNTVISSPTGTYFEGIATTITGLQAGSAYNVSVHVNGNYVNTTTWPIRCSELIVTINGVSAPYPNTSTNTWVEHVIPFVATGTTATFSIQPRTGAIGCVANLYVAAVEPAITEADLFISKTDNSATYTPDTNLVYTIVVGNNGPSDVQNARVADPLPAGISAASWTCGGATGGGLCGAASGSGAIDTTVNLPAGASVTYTLTMSVPSTATGNLTNTATVTAPAGITDTNLSNNSASDTNGFLQVTVAKTADTIGPVKVGDTVTYTLTTDVTGSSLAMAYPLSDTLGPGLTFGAVTNAGAYTCGASGNVLNCALPAGTAPGTYAVTYTATVSNQATGSVSNAVVSAGCSSACNVVIPVQAPATSTRKMADTAGRVTVTVGDTVTYTLTTDVTGSQLTAPYPLTDTLGAGLTFGAVTNAGAYTCSASGNTLNCTLPAGTVPGTYAVSYTAMVNDQAIDSVRNAVRGTGCTGGCEVTIPVAATTRTRKAADTTGPVKVGDTVTYTLITEVSNSQLTGAYPLTDTLGIGLTFGAVNNAGAYTCAVSGNVLSCTLPAGTAPGSYAVTYTATVNDQATGSVSNAVVGAGCTGGCEVITPVQAPATHTRKAADTAGPVAVGDIVTYTLTTDVSNSQLIADYPLTDTLGTGLTFGAVSDAGAYTCAVDSNVLNCTLPAGTVPGSHAMSYTATVNNHATGRVSNSVVSSGCTTACEVVIPVVEPRVTYRKVANTAGPVKPDDTVAYTLTMAVSGSRLTAPYTLTDTLGTGLTFGSVSNPGAYTCSANASVLTCTLPAGTVPGSYAVTYTATINAQAGDSVRNAVIATGPDMAECADVCSVDIEVSPPQVRVTKVAGAREAKVGDMVRYAVTVENTGARHLVNGHAVDVPPAGFTYVEGSLRVSGADTQVRVSGQSPLRFEGIDVPVGQSATLTYLMRVGAGVRQGAQVNQVRVYSEQGTPISNVATAEVTVTGDPLLDDSLIFGTVFNDRNGDGWQDNDEPGIPGVRIASVDGLLIETDPFGRYHLAGVPGGAWERGRNFILKVDPSTLPAGTEFTTDNPLLRRITPGVPVRFDWGVKLPEQVIEDGMRQDELDRDEVSFAPASGERVMRLKMRLFDRALCGLLLKQSESRAIQVTRRPA